MKVLKFLKAIFILLLVIVIFIGVGGVVFLKVYDLNRLRPQIIQSIERSTGFDVGISKLAFNFSFLEGVTLDLHKFSLKDDPGFSEENLFEAKIVSLHIQLIPLITKQQLISPEVIIDSPRLKLLANEKGVLNLQSLLKSASEKNRSLQKKNGSGSLNMEESTPSIEKASDGDESTNPQKETSLSDALPAIIINSFTIKNGEVDYSQGPFDEKITIPLRNINFEISNFSLYKPFNFDLSCALWKDQDNIQVQGKGLVNVVNQELRLDNVLFVMDFEQMSFARIQKDIRSMDTDLLKSCKEGKMNLLIKQIVLGDKGLVSLSADANLSDLRFDFINNKYPINTINAKAEISKEQVLFKEVFIKIASGEIHLNGKITDYLTNPQESFILAFKGINLQEAIHKEDTGYDISGMLSGKFEGKSSSFDPARMIDSLRAGGIVNVQDATLHDVNLLKMALDKIPNISNLNERIENNLPERLKEKLKEKDTKFEKIAFPLSFSNGELLIQDAQVTTTEFDVAVNGKIDRADNLLVRSSLTLSNDLSKHLIESVEEFSCLSDLTGRVLIRLKEYQGEASKVKIYPDPKDIMSRMGKCQLRNVIRKAVGGEVDSQNATSQDSILVPVFDGKEVPVDVDPIIDKALDIFNDLF